MSDYLPEGKLIHTPENRAIIRSPRLLEEAMHRGTILEARAVLCDSAHNLLVELGCMRGVIPREEGALGMRDGSVRDIAVISRVNRPVCFTVTAIETDENGEPYALLSRADAQQRCRDNYLSALGSGDVVDAAITHLENFGAFADVGCGIPALLPIDAISVSRIEHPRERFAPGMDIRAVIKSIENGRISLSHKELLGTWEENAAAFSAGETVAGIVRSVENYGAFIELTPNLAGLAESREGVRSSSSTPSTSGASPRRRAIFPAPRISTASATRPPAAARRSRRCSLKRSTDRRSAPRRSLDCRSGHRTASAKAAARNCRASCPPKRR